MTIAMMTNILTMVLCLAVLVQSVRMMRNLRKVKDGALTEVVRALEKATGEARSVLSDMKVTLGRDCADNARLVTEAKALRDELSDIIGIADAAAERIVVAVGSANAARVGGNTDDEDEVIYDAAAVPAETEDADHMSLQDVLKRAIAEANRDAEADAVAA